MEVVTATEAPSLDSAELFVNRELSWLQFNERVLELAEDAAVPLLERVKFNAIYSSNLDEFVMVRVAGLHDQVDAGIDARGPDGLAPGETLELIGERLRELGRRHSRVWAHELCPQLAEQGIRVIDPNQCTSEELDEVDRVFSDQIFPVLTPLAVGPGRPFPYISNLSLSLAVWLRDPVSGTETFARVKVPKEVLPRFVPIDRATFVPLEAIIARHLDELFPGMQILRHDYFRVTRDADFTVSDEADDLLRAVEDELRRRRFGEVVRLEISKTMDPDMRRYLVEQLAIDESQVMDVDGLLDMEDLWAIYEVDGHRELRDPPWTPVNQPAFADGEDGRVDMLAAIRAEDILVHHPYDSFAGSVERFIQQAVGDPEVLAIKMTVYRTSDDSALIPALIEAAERGKQAVCLVELKARFDERRNIGWARSLEEAGAHVVHGLPGLKTHAKALLVVRREGSGVRHYVHIGTGNYHAKTARLYEDFGLFTTDREIAQDVAELFNALTGAARSPEYRKAIVAPDHMRKWFLREVERTVEAHRNGLEARIVLKLNSLVDARCIRALYAASQAGVRVDVNVRGICCLRAGVPDVSENIQVVSVVGRFLEHCRVYGFWRGDERRYWMGSADLMPRNLDTRVELLTPVVSGPLTAEIEDTLERCFADDTFAWELRPDESWERRRGGTRSVHRELMERALERSLAD
ncbi:MAG TPA: polyphosphate kinase 1 [Thermoleophilaceae bacterium]|jgi:polyphosphate kinase|nr:polyphosphate kinase 1 [Thermoleophilaceae bacterium]